MLLPLKHKNYPLHWKTRRIEIHLAWEIRVQGLRIWLKKVADLLTRAISLDVSKELKSKENSEIVKKILNCSRKKLKISGNFLRSC